MTIAYADFVSAFPEFSNATTYPTTQINFWIPIGYEQLNAYRFGAQIGLAVMLFVAHNVVLSAREAAAANAGQIVGEVKGPVTAKSVDKVSVSFSSDTAIEGAGAWNFTTYGQRLYRMIKAYSAGPFYVPGPRRAFGA
jgi:hypothetical protein